MNAPMKSIIANGIVIILLSLILLVAGTWWRMSSQYALGETALRKGDYTAAVAAFQSAIHMYLPFNPLIESAAERLWAIGETNERLGDVNRALIAYRSLRSSFYADHWLTTPGTAWIEKCDKKIAALIPLQHER